MKKQNLIIFKDILKISFIKLMTPHFLPKNLPMFWKDWIKFKKNNLYWKKEGSIPNTFIASKAFGELFLIGKGILGVYLSF